MRIYHLILGTFLLIVMASGCRKNPADTDSNPYHYNPDWTAVSHENRTPDYNTIFPQNEINTIEITLSHAQWNSINNDMNVLFGVPFGAMAAATPENNSGIDPEYVDVNVKFNGKNWKNVGFRLRGNKMLGTIWNNGIYKLPFHLNFDKFEDQIPGIKNQRFFGFKEMIFNPGYKDPSLIRDKLAGDLFRMGGIAAPQTAFYKVYIDFGAGSKYCGIYCATELPEDNLLLDSYGEKAGNIYKPTSQFNLFRQDEFLKKNNEDNADYSDAQAFVYLLNSPSRISNPAQWHADINGAINVDQFLNWLAISNAMVNPGGYGSSAENYYLYHHSDGKFVWVPWDNNEAMNAAPGIVGAIGGNGNNGLSLSMNEVTANWPLIRYLIDDPAYCQVYKNHLSHFNNTYLIPTDMNARIDKYFDLISNAVIGTEGEQPHYTLLNNEAEFINERANLKNHFSSRHQLIQSYVP